MGIVKSYQKKTDTTYVYESEAYWDPEKKQSRSKRRLIGKIDKETGEIVPTGKRGRKKKMPSNLPEPLKSAGRPGNSDLADRERIGKLESVIEEQKAEIIDLKTQVDSLRKENSKLLAETREAKKQADRSRQAESFFRDFGSLAARAKKDGLLDPP